MMPKHRNTASRTYISTLQLLLAGGAPLVRLHSLDVTWCEDADDVLPGYGKPVMLAHVDKPAKAGRRIEFVRRSFNSCSTY